MNWIFLKNKITNKNAKIIQIISLIEKKKKNLIFMLIYYNFLDCIAIENETCTNRCSISSSFDSYSLQMVSFSFGLFVCVTLKLTCSFVIYVRKKKKNQNMTKNGILSTTLHTLETILIQQQNTHDYYQVKLKCQFVILFHFFF